MRNENRAPHLKRSRLHSLAMEPLEDRRMLSCTTADSTAIAIPSMNAGEIVESGDSNCFSFSATQGSIYEFSTTAGVLDDTVMQLFDVDGTSSLAADDDDGVEFTSKIIWTATSSGDYFVEVRGFSTDTGDYTFEAKQISIADDHGSDAASATLVSVPSTTNGNFEVDSDRDFLAFAAVAGTQYNFFSNAELNSGIFLRLVGTDGGTILDSGFDDGTTSDPAISWLAPASGTHFVEVAGRENDSGSYAVEIRTVTDDHGDDISNATALTFPSSTTSTIDFKGDEDFFEFTAIPGIVYDFSAVKTSSSSSSSTPNFSLQDSNGTELFSESDLQWVATAGGTYYLSVTNRDAGRIGGYRLDVAEGTLLAVAVPSTTNGNGESAFSFSATAGTQYNLISTYGENSSSSYLRLLDTDAGTLLKSGVRDTTNRTQKTTWTAPTDGTYYVAVEFSGTYTFEIEVPTDDHGDTVSNATSLALPASTSAKIDFQADEDYFAFTPTAGSLYNFSAAEIASSGVSPILSLYDGTTEIADDDAETLDWVAPTAGTFFLRVAADEYYDFGNYSLDVTEVAYSDDHGNLPTTATTISNPSTTSGDINVAADKDLFAFTATAGTNYNVFATTQNGVTPVRVLDTDGATTLSSSNLFWTASSNGIFYFEVTGRVGTYTLDILTMADDHGDLVSHATAINLPASITATIDFESDEDFFAFTAIAGGLYEFSASQSDASDVFPYLWLYDGTTPIVIRYSLSTFQWMAPTTGTYYLRVVDSGGNDIGDYVIDATEATYDDDHSNLTGGATVVSIPSLTDGHLEVEGDRDLFAFTATAGTEYNLLANADSLVSPVSLRLIDTDGVTTIDSTITWTAPVSGTYYAEVAGLAGTYVLDIHPTTDDGGTTTTITFPTSVAAKIDREGDHDYFSFTATAGNLYSFSGQFAIISLYDGETILDESYTKPLHWIPPTTGTYSLRVAGFNDTSVGDYAFDAVELIYSDDHGNLTTAATAIAIPSTTLGEIEVAGDHDFFEFTTIAGSSYSFSALPTTSGSLMPRLAIYDGATKIDEATDGSLYWTATAAATYYLKVDNSFGDAIGEYTLDTTALIYADDHGNLTSSATPLAIPSITNGEINLMGDHDFFEFTATAGSLYQFSTRNGPSSNSTVQSIYDANGTLLPGASAIESLQWIAPMAGTYYVKVADVGTNDISEYTLDVAIANYTDDHGNLSSSATPVSIPSTTEGDLEATGDHDIFAFTATAGTRYHLFTTPGSLFDAVIRLVDTDGVTILDANEEDTNGPSTLITWTAPVGGTYYLEVMEFNNSGTGTYILDVLTDQLPCDFVGGNDGCDIQDMNALYAGTNGAPAPLTDAYITQWLNEASDPSNPLKANASDVYVYGDVDLDGDVDSIDLGLLLNNFLDTSGLGWGGGNLNSDSAVDSIDLGLQLNNFGFTSFATSAFSMAATQPLPITSFDSAEATQPWEETQDGDEVDFAFVQETQDDAEDDDTELIDQVFATV